MQLPCPVEDCSGTSEIQIWSCCSCSSPSSCCCFPLESADETINPKQNASHCLGAIKSRSGIVEIATLLRRRCIKSPCGLFLFHSSPTAILYYIVIRKHSSGSGPEMAQDEVAEEVQEEEEVLSGDPYPYPCSRPTCNFITTTMHTCNDDDDSYSASCTSLKSFYRQLFCLNCN